MRWVVFEIATRRVLWVLPEAERDVAEAQSGDGRAVVEHETAQPGDVLREDLTVEAATIAEDASAALVRTERDRLLSASDWTQLPDAPVDAAAWAAYRQALRDVTDQPGFPLSVSWPARP